MRKPRAVLLAAGLLACGGAESGGDGIGTRSPAASAPESAFSARRVDDSVLLVNADSVPIYFAVFPTDVLPRIEWRPCVVPVDCPHVPPGDTLLQPAPRPPASSSAGGSLTVFWWRLVPVPGAERWAPDQVRPIELPAHVGRR